VSGEDAAEVGRDGAGRVGVSLPAERVLEASRAEREVLVLAAEVGGVVVEVAEAVLLAQRPQAHHEDARHQEELHEPVLALRRVRQQPRRSPAPEAAAAHVRHLCLRRLLRGLLGFPTSQCLDTSPVSCNPVTWTRQLGPLVSVLTHAPANTVFFFFLKLTHNILLEEELFQELQI